MGEMTNKYAGMWKVSNSDLSIRLGAELVRLDYDCLGRYVSAKGFDSQGDFRCHLMLNRLRAEALVNHGLLSRPDATTK